MSKIKSMYAFISEDTGPNDEGVIAQKFGGVWMPLVGADMKRVESLKALALLAAKQSGKKVTLVQFTNRVELEVIPNAEEV